jgi:hypothetical protein
MKAYYGEANLEQTPIHDVSGVRADSAQYSLFSS